MTQRRPRGLRLVTGASASSSATMERTVPPDHGVSDVRITSPSRSVGAARTCDRSAVGRLQSVWSFVSPTALRWSPGYRGLRRNVRWPWGSREVALGGERLTRATVGVPTRSVRSKRPESGCTSSVLRGHETPVHLSEQHRLSPSLDVRTGSSCRRRGEQVDRADIAPRNGAQSSRDC
jgi:hypothetical protein